MTRSPAAVLRWGSSDTGLEPGDFVQRCEGLNGEEMVNMMSASRSYKNNVEMINTSEVRVNVVVDGTHGHEALAALQEAFADSMR